MNSKDDLVCDCEVIHGDIVNEVKKRMPDDEDIMIYRISLRCWVTAQE